MQSHNNYSNRGANNSTGYNSSRGPSQYSVPSTTVLDEDLFTKKPSTALNTKTTYHLELRVQKKLENGQSLCVCGSIPELGNWKNFTCQMKWTRDDYWVLQKPLVTNKYYFSYKYVVMKDNARELEMWERGVDRVADLEILPEETASTGAISYDVNAKNYQSERAFDRIKRVQLADVFEEYSVHFSVMNPKDAGTDEMVMEENSEEIVDQYLEKNPLKKGWMTVKYGEDVRPWRCQVRLKNTEGSNTGQWKPAAENVLRYRYGKKGSDFPSVCWEREPTRSVQIQNPHDYGGELGAQGSKYWLNTDTLWIVNGQIHKADGNFLDDFFITKLGDTRICIGSHPQSSMDVQAVQQKGVTAVLDIQNAKDRKDRQLQPERLNQLYQGRGINTVVYQPVADNRIDEYCSHLFDAAKKLNSILHGGIIDDAVARKDKVLVHCTTGASRSATLAMAYLALYVRHPSWNKLDELHAFIRSKNAKALPNLVAVQRVINLNLEFQNLQKRLRDEEEEARRRRLEEANRAGNLQAGELKAQIDELTKLIAAEKERLRLQRLNFATAEKQRIQRIRQEDEDFVRKMKEIENRYQKLLQELLDAEDSRQKLRNETNKRIKDEAAAKQDDYEAQLKELQLKLKSLKDQLEAEIARIKKERDERDRDYRKWRQRIQAENDEIERIEDQKKLEHDRIWDSKKRAEREAQKQRSDRLSYLRAERQKQDSLLQEEMTLLARQKELEPDYLQIHCKWEHELKIRKEKYEKKKAQLEQDKLDYEQESGERTVRRERDDLEHSDKIQKIREAQDEAERLRRERQAMEAVEREKIKTKMELKEKELIDEKMRAEAEAENLLRRLKEIEQEEAERIRQSRNIVKAKTEIHLVRKAQESNMQRPSYGSSNRVNADFNQSNNFNDHFDEYTNPSNSGYEQQLHVTDGLFQESTSNDEGEFDIGLDEEQLDLKCDELFEDTPIRFEPRANNQIDDAIAYCIQEFQINIPVIWIKSNLYLIGSQRISCKFTNEQLICRVGGGYEQFRDYVPSNQRYFQRMLVVHMIKSGGQSLEWVVDQLVQGKKIQSIQEQIKLQAAQERKFRKSASPMNRVSSAYGSAFGSSSPRLLGSQYTPNQYRGSRSPNTMKHQRSSPNFRQEIGFASPGGKYSLEKEKILQRLSNTFKSTYMNNTKFQK